MNQTIKIIQDHRSIRNFLDKDVDDETMAAYLKEIGREQEGNWSTYTSGIYKYVYFPKVYPTIIDQGFKNDK